MYVRPPLSCLFARLTMLLRADYTVVSDIHKPKEASLTEKAKQATGIADDIGWSSFSVLLSRSRTGCSSATFADSYVPALPVVAFKFTDEFKKEYPRIKQRSIQKLLRENNWCAAFPLPPLVNSSAQHPLSLVLQDRAQLRFVAGFLCALPSPLQQY